MTDVRFYGRGLSGVQPTALPGKLIVLEGLNDALLGALARLPRRRIP